MATFLTVSPTSGTENGTLTVTVPQHTGRSSRSNRVVVTATSNATKKATVVVTQAAASMIFTKVSATPATENTAAIPFTIKGTSNAAKLGFGACIKVSNTYMVFGPLSNVTLKINGTAVTPTKIGTFGYTASISQGTDAQYTFEFSGTLPASTAAYDRTFEGFATNNESFNGNGLTEAQHTAAILTGVLTSKGGVASVSVTPTTSALTAAGGSISLDVTSNDNWTATVTE